MLESNLSSLALLRRGKVRDVYEVDSGHLLLVATDRLSAFDVVFPTPIPDKGKILTALSTFWFSRLRPIIANHLTAIAPELVVEDSERAQVEDRSVVVKRTTPLLIEAVVRGYLAGSAWAEYAATGRVCGMALPPGLEQAAQLSVPIFTASTKAEMGSHDENLTYGQVENLIGVELARRVRTAALRLYSEASAHALERGIIIADTKFEFGLDEDGELLLIDEALTPDSSRFWRRDGYVSGHSPESFDKQFFRDWLSSIHFAKQPPAPEVPPEVVSRVAEKYREALIRLTSNADVAGRYVDSPRGSGHARVRRAPEGAR